MEKRINRFYEHLNDDFEEVYNSISYDSGDRFPNARLTPEREDLEPSPMIIDITLMMQREEESQTAKDQRLHMELDCVT